MQYEYAKRMGGLSGSAIREILKMTADPSVISFAGGMPSASSFPTEELAQISSELLLSQGTQILQYGTTEGWGPLRESMAEVMAPRGIACKPENVLILTGSSQGIELFTKVMIDPGDVILCEAPTFLGALQTFHSYEARVIGIPMDEDGVNIQALEEAMKAYSPKFFYTIPTFQNPSGCTMSLHKRKRVAQLAEAYNTLILEDDPYGSLRYCGEALPSIASFDENGRVMHLVSFSKTISPGLRVGAAVGNPDMLRRMTINKQGADTHTSNLSQAVVDAYIRKGRFFPHIDEVLGSYREQLNTMLDCFSEFPAGTTYTRPEGGLFIWCELPGGINAQALMQEAVARKVAYVPGTFFYPDLGHENTLRLNFSASDPVRIAQGMHILAELIQDKLA